MAGNWRGPRALATANGFSSRSLQLKGAVGEMCVTNSNAAPDAGASDKRLGKAIAPFAAALLVLSASFANFLSYHDYSALRPEVAIIAAMFVAIAAMFAAAHRGASDFGKALLDGFLVFLAVDLNSDQVLVAAGAAMVVAFLRLGRGLSLLEPLSIVALVVLASSFTGLSERRPSIATVRSDGPAPANNKRPAVLHLILDEHGGSGGSADPVFRRELAQFYTGRGFRLFERAYSRHFHTVNAVPDVLNFGSPGNSRNIGETLDIGRTAYLSRFEKEGYALNIYQSDFADFCRYARTATCTNYWSPSMSFLEDRTLAAREKARLLVIKFVALSDLALPIIAAIDDITRWEPIRQAGVPVMAPKERAVSNSVAGFAILDRMTDDLKQARPGNVYFAHVLAPHYPYAFDRHCRLIAPSAWEYRRSSRTLAVREAAYREQVRCLLGRLDKLFAAFESSPAGGNGVIVIHGDHGSRVTEVEPGEWNRGKIKPWDFMAGYSTLFAVKAPGISSGSDPTPYPVPAILRRLSDTRFASTEGLRPGTGQVFLDNQDWTVASPASLAKAWPAPD